MEDVALIIALLVLALALFLLGTTIGIKTGLGMGLSMAQPMIAIAKDIKGLLSKGGGAPGGLMGLAQVFLPMLMGKQGPPGGPTG